LFADDNIISNNPDAALELAKSINPTEAEEAEAARKVHATNARIMTEYVPKSTKKKSGGRSSKSVVIQDTLSAPKSKPATLKTKLKGAPSLTPEEQKAADIMQALKESDEEITDAAKADAKNTSKGTKETHNRSYSEILSAANSLVQDHKRKHDDDDDEDDDDEDPSAGPN
nr:hypothetical protein [Tanacetum cinerariifolium]